MKSIIEAHNRELHRSADSVRRLVDEANEKSTALEGSLVRISQAEARLVGLTDGIEVFAATQDNAIKMQTSKLKQLSIDIGAALQGIDGKLEAAVSET